MQGIAPHTLDDLAVAAASEDRDQPKAGGKRRGGGGGSVRVREGSGSVCENEGA